MLDCKYRVSWPFLPRNSLFPFSLAQITCFEQEIFFNSALLFQKKKKLKQVNSTVEKSALLVENSDIQSKCVFQLIQASKAILKKGEKKSVLVMLNIKKHCCFHST